MLDFPGEHLPNHAPYCTLNCTFVKTLYVFFLEPPMPRAPKFTDRNIKADAKPGKRLFVRDCPNLYLYTSRGPKKRQRWILRISRPDGSGVTERSLGRYPDVTLEMAKNRANH